MQHKYLTDSSGSLLKFVRMLDEKCTVCNPNSQGAKLGVLMENEKQETVCCEACDFETTRPRTFVPIRQTMTVKPTSAG